MAIHTASSQTMGLISPRGLRSFLHGELHSARPCLGSTPNVERTSRENERHCHGRHQRKANGTSRANYMVLDRGTPLCIVEHQNYTKQIDWLHAILPGLR